MYHGKQSYKILFVQKSTCRNTLVPILSLGCHLVFPFRGPHVLLSYRYEREGGVASRGVLEDSVSILRKQVPG